MNVLVVGCGYLGCRLAETLWHHGHHVSIIDSDEASFSQLNDDFDGMTIAGMPMDMTVLRNAGVESCDAVAVVTSDDNLNITVSQIVIEFFKIENVVTRVTDPAREKAFNYFGMKTVCQTKLSCEAIFAAVTNNLKEKQLSFGNNTLSFKTKTIEPILIGRSLETVPMRPGEVILGVIDEHGKISMYDRKNEIILNSKDQIIYTKIIM